MNWLDSRGDERPNQRRGNTQMGNLMALNHFPDPVRRGVVRGSFIQEGSGTERKATNYQPWSHHPAHVGEPEHHLIRPKVEQMRHILRRLERETRVIMNGALGFAGRTRCIDEHERVHTLHWLASHIMVKAPLNRFVPSYNPTFAEVRIHPPDNHDSFDTARRHDRVTRGFYELNLLSTAVKSISGDQDFCSRIL